MDLSFHRRGGPTSKHGSGLATNKNNFMVSDGVRKHDDCAGEDHQQIISLRFLVIFIMKTVIQFIF
jgi:hypothetical protein